MEREELPRVSVGSLTDWQRVKNNYSAAALSSIQNALDSQHLQSERDAVLAHFNHVRSFSTLPFSSSALTLSKFMDSTFSMAQANLRVNGHNFESMSRAGQGQLVLFFILHHYTYVCIVDMEAFDEALDRRIWSLADTRLQWHKRMARTRRETPREIQARLFNLFDKGLTQDQSIFEASDTASQDDETADGRFFDVQRRPFDASANVDSQPLSLEAVEEFQMTSAITQELDQVCRTAHLRTSSEHVCRTCRVSRSAYIAWRRLRAS